MNEHTTKERIDALLQYNASIRANLYTRSMRDVGSQEKADTIWMGILEEIREMDVEAYEQLASAEEREMLLNKVYSKVQWRNRKGKSV
jgi:hypothetical protein